MFGPVHWTSSADGGRTWSAARPPDGMEEGVCDAVPEYHAPTGTVLVLGFNVYYRDDVLAQPNEDRHVPYAVFDPATGSWSGRQRLVWDDPLASANYTSNCSQRVTLDARDGERAGDVIVPLSFGPRGRLDRFAASRSSRSAKPCPDPATGARPCRPASPGAAPTCRRLRSPPGVTVGSGYSLRVPAATSYIRSENAFIARAIG